MQQDKALRGLLARLELDSGLGIQYMPEVMAGELSRLNVFAEHVSPAPFRRTDSSHYPIQCTATSHQQVDRILHSTPDKAQALEADPSGNDESAPIRQQAESSSRRHFRSATSRVSSENYDESGTTSIRTRVSLVPLVEPPPHPEKEAALSELKEACLVCEECGLCERRNSVVWGEGNLDADVMFIGEGPGRDEDAEGRPFVGRSGRLLTDIIEKGMKTPRSNVYIANVVKCRPPGNRDPHPDEVAACSRYLDRQIEVIAPKVIVAVGSVAGRTLLRTEASGGLRGRWHEYSGIPLRVIYHPSYLLRMRRTEHDRTAADRTTWMDIQEVMAKLEPSSGL